MNRAWLAVGIVGVLGVATIAACADDDATVDPGTDGGLDARINTDTGSGTSGNLPDTSTPNPPADAGSDADDPITDGGSNLDPDANDDDAGNVGCNTFDNTAPIVTPSCVSRTIRLGGGPLIAGKYHLTGVQALGTAPFCANQFVPTPLKETLDLTVDGQGTAIANYATEVGATGVRRRTFTYDPADASASPLDVAQTCPPARAAAAPYDMTERDGGAHLLIIRKAYGRDTALYRYTRQP